MRTAGITVTFSKLLMRFHLSDPCTVKLIWCLFYSSYIYIYIYSQREDLLFTIGHNVTVQMSQMYPAAVGQRFLRKQGHSGLNV